ncbi:MAG: hypothetical protein N2255_06190, partial [Kiritimatiellae bacterium]|nr:hypothetical protein [Kiritimatiellia bacterium]
MRHLPPICALCLAAWLEGYRSTAFGAAETNRQPGVVQILVTYQEQEVFQPWQRRQPGTRNGYGVLIAPDRILTTESLIRNHRLVEILKPESGEKLTACLELSDSQVNLALLRVKEARHFEDVGLLAIVEDMPRKARVTALQFDRTDRVQTVEGHVLEVVVAKLPNAPYQSLTFTVLTALNVEGPGVPVLYEGKLAGLIMNYSRTSRTGEMIPYPVLKRFLEDASSPPYEGFATAGFVWGRLTDPTKRRYLKLRHEGHGVQVLRCLPRSGADEQLKPGDVILAWDGELIDNLGYYSDREFGRLIFTNLIKMRRKPGDLVPVQISRNGIEFEVKVRLERYDDNNALIPENVTGEDEGFLVEGGLILRELTGQYIRAHGSDWMRTVDPRLAHLYLTKRYDTTFPGERIVLLAGILDDPINIGYETF